MNTLLLLFALPVSTIILSIVFQKILRSPLLVAATFFAIYLIVTYTAFDSSFLIYAILYTILAYVTAILTRLICQIKTRYHLYEQQNEINSNNNNGAIAIINENQNNATFNGNNNGRYICRSGRR